MAIQQLIPAAKFVGGNLLQGGADLIGGEFASKAMGKAEKAARKDFEKGLGEAKGYYSPLYEQGTGVYSDLVGGYQAGEFERPDFSFDPASVFQDPEFDAAMRAGASALGSSAEAKGDLFSTGSQQALQQFGQDLFSTRADELFDRAVTEEELGRQADLTSFDMGMSLAQPGINAAAPLADLAYGGGKELADMRLMTGRRRAGDAIRRSNILGETGQKLLGAGVDLLGTGG